VEISALVPATITRKPSKAEEGSLGVCCAVKECLKNMQELDKLFSHIQTRQAAGKAANEMKHQLIQQAAQMEDAHKELANTIINADLMK
jgi:hypothetical protein